jgi:hypothetical protein
MDFFYDRQIESYLLQFIRIFSDIKIQLDPDENGVSVQKRVPIQYGDMSRMVAHIIKDNNQNVILPSPSMAATITGLTMNDERRADPKLVSYMNGAERYFNKETGEYEDKIGNKYTVFRYMPSPYDMELTLDIMSPNTQTKLQILEQILTIFNPGLQLQHNDSVFDWTSIFEIRLKDITWTNKSFPMTDSKDDVATLKFICQIWLSAPAKLKRQRMIEKIYTNFYDGDIDSTNSLEDLISNPLWLRLILSSTDHTIDVSLNENNVVEVTLLGKYGEEDVENITWEKLLQKFGTIIPGTSTLRLKIDDNLESEEDDVFGFIEHHPTIKNKLIFTVDEDTLPETTLVAISRFIDAIKMYPGNYYLPPAQLGQRYLLLSDHTNGEEEAIANSPVWGDLAAYENDIIEHNGTGWVISFNSQTNEGVQYIKNILDGQHYKYDGNSWVYTYLGRYNIGYWSLENLAPL